MLGMGALTPLGLDLPTTWAALLAGHSGIGPITRFDASRAPVRIAAEVALPGEGPALYRAMVDRVLDEALVDVDLSRVAPGRIGVFVGAEAIRPRPGALPDLVAGVLPPTAELAAHAPLATTLHVAARTGARGPQATLSTACTSSAHAVEAALHALREDRCEVAVVVGVDALSHPLMVLGFSRLGALSERNDDPTGASRPFDRDRDGFVLGEGAGALVLARGDAHGPVQGWLTGAGGSSNAWRITDAPPDGRGAAECLAAALRDAGTRQVAWVCAHGTGTQQNDVSEARGVRTVLGEHALLGSPKSMLGHLVATCGVVEAAVSLCAARDRVAPPTRNLDNPDPDCAVVDLVGPTPRELGAGAVVSNSFGFGGSNVSLVLEAP